MTNKLKYFIGNWKMFGDLASFKIISKINTYISKNNYINKKKIVICVPNILINFFVKKLKKKSISIGAQNCHHHEASGPFTGSVNASMLKKMGSEYIILGHSENRKEGESPKLIEKKIESSLNQKLNVIYCIGETSHEKKRGKTYSIIQKQIKECIKKSFNKKRIMIAYEPIWCIGSNKIPNINELKYIIKYIKISYKKIFKTKNFPKVLYGGSVNGKNVKLLSNVNEIDGFLIGSASQSSKKFIDIIKNYYK